MLATYAEKLDKTQRSEDWEQATKSVREASRSGSLPAEFEHSAQVCERAFQALPDQDKQYIRQVSPDTQHAIFMLVATISQEYSSSSSEGGQGEGKVTAIRHLVEQVAKEASQGTRATN